MFSFSDVLRSAWNTYTRYFGIVFLLYTLLVLPIYLGMDYLPDYAGVTTDEVSNTARSTVSIEYASDIDAIAAALDVDTAFLSYEVGLNIFLIIVVFAISLSLITLVHHVWNTPEKVINVQSILRDVSTVYIPAAITLIGFFIVYALIAALPFVVMFLLNVPDWLFLSVASAVSLAIIWTTPYFLFIPHSIIVGKEKYIAAVKASYALAKGNWIKIMGQYIGILLFMIPLIGILTMVTLPITESGIFGTEALILFVTEIVGAYATLFTATQYMYLKEEATVIENALIDDTDEDTVYSEEQENEEE